ncbi:MAG: sigma 54-interacting transcriptional regulator [candidate division Zixibacteria bacterium]|nr:sigma 54-interacting transcriptional regulator [candidate division Zixibacteria bacterium]
MSETKTEPEYFILEERLSANNLSESWLARDTRDGHRCFLKIPAGDPQLGHAVIEAILRTSLTCQRQLYNRHILTAVRRHSYQNRLYIEYPYLSRQIWRELSPELFWANYPESLIHICLIIDYVHLQNLVHGDIKLQNFQISDGVGKPRLLLIDLDFLMPANSPVNARIFGTREFIAPEIINNDTVLPVSDNYSLGIAVRGLLDPTGDMSSPGRPDPAIVGKLATFSDALTAESPIQRPSLLIEALHRFGIVDDTGIASLRKRLFLMQIAGNFRINLAHVTKGNNWLARFFKTENHVFGVPDELLTQLEQLTSIKPKLAFRILVRLLQKADVHRFGDYWHLRFTDDDLRTALKATDAMTRGKSAQRVLTEMQATDDLDRLSAIMTDLQANDLLLRTFLDTREKLKTLGNESEPKTDDARLRLHRQLIMLSLANGRLDEALDHFSESLRLADHNGVRDYRLLFLYAFHLIIGGQPAQAEKSLMRGIEQLQGDDSLADRLAFQRLLAYVLTARGRHQEAEVKLQETLETATAHGLHEEVIKLYTVLGTLYFVQGDFNRAGQSYQQGLKIQKQYKVTGDVFSLYSNVAMMYQELSEFKKCITYNKLALKHIGGPVYHNRLLNVYGALCTCNINLNEYDRAEYWMNMIILKHPYQIEVSHFKNFFQHQANFYFKQGMLDQAEQAVVNALSLYTDENRDNTIGYCYRVLTVIYAQRGNIALMETYLDKLRAFSEEFHNQTYLVELDYARTISQLPMAAFTHRGNLISLLRKLAENNMPRFSTRCLILIFLYGNTADRTEALKIISHLLPQIEKQETAIFKAVWRLIDDATRDESVLTPGIDACKRTYLELYQSGARHLAMLVCIHVAERYGRRKQIKQASNFFKQALKICDELGNHTVADYIRQRQEVFAGERVEDRTLMAESLLSISRILQHVDEYERALHELVGYAVQMTGAERGVILLRSKNSTALNIKAAVGCDDDEQSLTDIRNFSENIPKNVAEALTPVVVENALEDKRTRKYDSIIAHNIMSVICVPIKITDNAFGVLYLDHHTIPALFDRDDVLFISSIANFMSVLLNTIQEFRDIRQEKEQQDDKLRQLGASQHFVTQNRNLLKLLKELPLMARSKATILIIGESGTGKEILANEIHRQSGRQGKSPVKVNCAAIPPNMIESELFGVGPKAFTDVNEREGKFTIADGGTVFLDEIGDMPLTMQAKLLSVIEYKTYSPVGSNRIMQPDICFICATNRDLKEMSRTGQFRSELLNRINTIEVTIPPLRERPEDIPLLIDYYVSVFKKNTAMPPVFTEKAMSALTAYSWPGNVRELRNMIERFCILYSGRTISVEDLSQEIRTELKDTKKSKRRFESEERVKICRYLRLNHGNQAKTARDMHMKYGALRRRIKKFAISKKDWS